MNVLGIQSGQSMEAKVTKNQLILTPVSKRFFLDELLAQCDMSAPEASEQAVWGKPDRAGDEVW